MKSIFFFFFTIIIIQGVIGQTGTNTIYYSPVNMPETLKNDYYGLFDPKLLAADLADLLKQATGTTFAIESYQPGVTTGIFLLLDSNKKTLGNEEGLFESDGGSFIRITARYTTGISYAMYSWLAELGFRFYLPGSEWSVIPALNDVFNNKTVSKTYKPYFRLRMYNASGGIPSVKGLDETGQNKKDWRLWYLRNRMGCEYISIGGHIGEAFNVAHRKEIEADSLIVAPSKGKRTYRISSKLDPTYKKGVDMFSDWIVSEYKKDQLTRPSFLPLKKYYSADAGDGLDYCHTTECESRFKTVSDQAFSIVNETAKKIKLADPRAGVSTLAYAERADTPGIKIEPNVHVMVVPAAYQSVSTVAGIMQSWKHKSNNISVYNYLNIGVLSYDKPFFNLQRNHYFMDFLKSLNIEGVCYETSLSKFGSGILQYFTLTYLCDPYSSIDKMLDEFCKDNFGAAANPVKELLREWYFSDVHMYTNYDHASFYEDELGRFIQYIIDAENTPGLSASILERIEELKAYTIYLCMFYELFCELKSLQDYSANPALRYQKADEVLTYTWQLYSTKIFQNTQLNEMLKQLLPDAQKEKWNYYKSDHYKTITNNASTVVKTQFEKMKEKYLPFSSPRYEITDQFLEANAKYSADSLCICTTDETSFGKFIYSLDFYCSAAGTLKISYEADSENLLQKKGKIALIGVESEDYKFIKNDLIYKEQGKGTISYQLSAKGHYKLYLSQYNATHLCYIIYPGKNIFYHHKKSILKNGLKMQNTGEKRSWPNKYIAFYAFPTDSIRFSNLYFSAKNTSGFYSASGKPIPVITNAKSFYNTIAVPKNEQPKFIFYENSQFRWPPVLKNTAPYYFFLRYPLK